jgi:curved DNA-binding protein CbpA
LQDYYLTLGVHPEAEDEVISAAYKALAKKYHPDTSGQYKSSQRFLEIKEAYDVLRNAERRSSYDLLRACRASMEAEPHETPDVVQPEAPVSASASREHQGLHRGFKHQHLYVSAICLGVFVVAFTALVFGLHLKTEDTAMIYSTGEPVQAGRQDLTKKQFYDRVSDELQAL